MIGKSDQKGFSAVGSLFSDSLLGLQWGASWLQLLSQEDKTPAIAVRLATVFEVTAKSLEHASLQEAATAVITHLAQTFSCDRVSFGLLEGNHMRICALSHSAQIDRRSELVRETDYPEKPASRRKLSIDFFTGGNYDKMDISLHRNTAVIGHFSRRNCRIRRRIQDRCSSKKEGPPKP